MSAEARQFFELAQLTVDDYKRAMTARGWTRKPSLRWRLNFARRRFGRWIAGE